MKKIIIAFWLISAVAFAQKEYKDEHMVSADKITRVYVDCDMGYIYLEPSADNNITVRSRKTVFSDDEKYADELTKSCKIEFKDDKDVLRVLVEFPDWKKSKLFGGIGKGDLGKELEVILKISLPANVNVDIETSSANVKVSELKNNYLTVKGSSSDISIENSIGTASLELSSGDVSIIRYDGSIDIDCSSSDIDINDTRGNVKISSSSGDGILEKITGDIRIYALEGSIIHSSSSGNLTIDGTTGAIDTRTASGTIKLRHLENNEGRFFASSTSGDVQFDLPANFGGNLELESTSGDIDFNAEVLLDSFRKSSENYISGTIGKGRGDIAIETVSGNIIVGN